MKEEVEILDAELRHYLLGELSPDEEQKIEERLLVNDNYVEQMKMVEDELIDDYLRGTLPPPQLEKYKTLFPATREGQQKLKAARVLKNQLAKFREPERTFLTRLQAVMAKVFAPPVLQTVAALLVVGLGVFGWRMFMRQSEGVYLNERPLEARISGAPYAPFTGIPNTPNQADTAKLMTEEKTLQESSTTNRGPEALHNLGKSYLAGRNLPQAFSKLSEALNLSPNDPALHVDFGIGFMELGKSQEGTARGEAFAASQKQMEEALRLKPNFPEALFNLALLHQVKGEWKEAESAWRQYLAVDPNSKWSKEAAQHLDAVVKAQK